MLHPRFFALPTDQPLSPDQEFKVLWYSQIAPYTLIRWRISIREEVRAKFEHEPSEGFDQDGESLWHEAQQIATIWLDGLELGTLEAPQVAAAMDNDPRSRIDSALGNYGVAPAIARALRSSRSRITFQN